MTKKRKGSSSKKVAFPELKAQQSALRDLLKEYQQLAIRLHEIHNMIYEKITDSLYHSAIYNVSSAAEKSIESITQYVNMWIDDIDHLTRNAEEDED